MHISTYVSFLPIPAHTIVHGDIATCFFDVSYLCPLLWCPSSTGFNTSNLYLSNNDIDFFGATQTVNAFATGHVEQLKTYVIQMFRF
jgi:hypothetical protein